MYQLSDDEIVLEDVPKNIRGFGGIHPAMDFALDGKEQVVLRAVEHFNSEDQPAGRKNIHAYLLEEGWKIAEQDIRFILKNLEARGLVEVNKGRRGTRITAVGQQNLHRNKRNPASHQ